MTDSEKTYSREQLRAAAYMGAGAGSAAVMAKVPDLVMPTVEIEQAVEEILRDFYPGAERQS